MAEILTCPKCEKKLQIPDQYLGQTVQCPECRHQFVAQMSAVSATPMPAASSSASAEGAHTRSRRFDEDDDDEVDIRRRRGRDEYDDLPRRHRDHSDYAPHRGGLVLALGLVALVGGFSFCVPVVIGPLAWIFGSIDLREMREGRMDPAGEGMTRSGQICGIIATLLMLLGIMFAAMMFTVG